MNMKIAPIVFSLLLLYACGGSSESETAKDSKDSTHVEKDTTLKDLERYFVCEKITQADFEKVAKAELAIDQPDTFHLEGERPKGKYEYEQTYIWDQDEIKLYGDTVMRQGDRLWIKIGDKKLFFDHKYFPEEELEEYSFKGVSHGVALLLMGGYEYMEAVFVDLHTGEKHTVVNVPELSPSGNQLMAVNSDLYAAFTDTKMEYFKRQENKWILQWTISPTPWGPAEMRWVDEQTIVLKREFANYDAEGSTYDYFRLTFK
jgi:hypothetical protein